MTVTIGRRKQLLRRGVGVVGVNVVRIDFDRLAIAFDVTAQIDSDDESVRCWRIFRPVGGKRVQCFAGVNPMFWRRAGIEHDVAEHSRRLRDQLLRTFSLSAAIAYPS